MAPQPGGAAGARNAVRGAAQRIPRDPAKAPRGQQPTVYPPPAEAAGAVQNAAAATKLPPRLQSAVASGKLTAEQAGQRFEQFKAGKLPGQGGGTSLGPMTTAGEFGQAGQSAAGSAPVQDGMVAQPLPGRAGGPSMTFPAPASPAAGGAPGMPNPDQVRQLMDRLRGAAAGRAPQGGGGMQAQTEVLQGPEGGFQAGYGGEAAGPLPAGYGSGGETIDAATARLRNPNSSGGPVDPAQAAHQAARGFQSMGNPLGGGGAVNEKPLFGAAGVPGQEDPIRARVKNILGGRGAVRGGGLQVA
ncbi:MAG TPA: hypothetical protein VJ725_07275 [Thermoanaerobaculia bacterium]|nr:hypothetical protein [Thermoanaerobaculia bacterium]